MTGLSICDKHVKTLGTDTEVRIARRAGESWSVTRRLFGQRDEREREKDETLLEMR